MELTPGTLVGEYEIQAHIGRGGQSSVYRALDTQLKRTVAVKFMTDAGADDPMSSKRFLLEAQALSAMNHPNIAAVHHIGKHEGHPYIVMEYVEGQTLSQFLAGHPLTRPEKYDLMIQVATAVAEAHRQGILHRDLKPANILVTTGGQVKLVDFGLAKLATDFIRERLQQAEELTTTGSILGTVSYVSPEQARSCPVDERSDLFSLGVIFYEMLAGCRPFDTASPISTLLAIINQAPAAPPDESAFPGPVDGLIRKLLAKEPAERFQSAEELLDALFQLKETELTQTTLKTPALRSPRRRKWWLPAGLAGLALISVSAWLWLRPAAGGTVPGPAASRDRVTLFIYPFEETGQATHPGMGGLITGEVVASLSRSRDVRVLSLPQGLSLADSQLKKQIFDRQGVRYTIDGHLSMNGAELKVAVKMTDLATASVVWSETFKGTAADLYTISDRIAGSTAHAAGIYVAASRLQYPGPEAFDLFTRGAWLLQAQDPDKLQEAIENLEKCIAVAPDFIPAYRMLDAGYMQYRNMGLDYHPRHLDQAYDIIRRGLARKPDDIGLQNDLAKYYLYTYDFPKSRQVYQRVLQSGQIQAINMVNLAWNHIYQGDIAKAIEYLHRSRELNPLSSVDVLNLVVLNAMHGRRQAAVDAYGQLDGIYTPDLVRSISRGWCLAAEDKLDEAEQEFRKAHDRYRYYIVLLAAAEVAFARGNYAQCADDLASWLKTNPYSLESHWMLGICRAQLGQAGERRESARQGARYAGELEKRYHSDLLRLFRIYFQVQAGDYRGTPEEIRRIDARHSDTISAYLQAITLAYLGEQRPQDQYPVPHNPIFWLNRFYRTEVELVSGGAPAAARP